MNFADIGKKAPWAWYALSLVVVILDLATKSMASNSLAMYERVQILPIFDITLRHNTGAAFSFLAGQGGWQVWFFSILSTVVSIVLIVWIYRVAKKNIWETLALSLVLGGAIGNLYDRVTLGYVVDFILFYYQDHQFPAFNVADMAITCGAAVLIYDTLFHRQNSAETASS